MGAREGCKYQLARVGMPWMYLHLAASLVDLYALIHMFYGKLGIDSL